MFGPNADHNSGLVEHVRYVLSLLGTVAKTPSLADLETLSMGLERCARPQWLNL
jgi:hypothetical protein